MIDQADILKPHKNLPVESSALHHGINAQQKGLAEAHSESSSRLVIKDQASQNPQFSIM